VDLGIAGRRAAVGGGSSGLGFGAAAALVADGVQVAICGRDQAKVEAAADQLGAGAVALVADLSTTDGSVAFVEEAAEALGGPLDILVPNAGGPKPGGFADLTVEDYQPALDLNLLSVVAMCQAAVPGMRERGWGRVVAITSISVRQPLPGLILSNTARAGTTAFLKTLAREVRDDGVTVNSVQPGSHDTERLRSLYGGPPPGRLGDAADFGKVVAFLCSEPAAFVTGAHLNVDGGDYPGLL
jgi:3-oxoacyl-[acyl-carrier protein] reductase